MLRLLDAARTWLSGKAYASEPAAGVQPRADVEHVATTAALDLMQPSSPGCSKSLSSRSRNVPAESPGRATPNALRVLYGDDELAKLSLAAYVDLWRRGNPHYLSHVTRQGFRDHAGMIYHTGGLGEAASGFTALLRDGKRLRPHLHLAGLTDTREHTVRAFLERHGVLTKPTMAEAQACLHALLHVSLAAAPRYPDKTAVHLSTETVANGLYGGETGNEIFFVFPADYIASRHAFAFNGRERDFTRPQSEEKWNDVFVWRDGGLGDQGLPIDSGIVFLPRNTPVDSSTGSRYATQAAHAPDGSITLTRIEDPGAVQRFREFWDANVDLWRQIALGEEAAFRVGRLQQHRKESDQLLVAAVGKLGATSEDAHAALFELGQAVAWHSEGNLPAQQAEDLVTRLNLGFLKAPEPIPAESYWERYFATHPEQRPARVVYYDGSPTDAVENFRRRNGLRPTIDSAPLLGFEDNLVSELARDPRARPSIDAIERVASQLIAERYPVGAPA